MKKPLDAVWEDADAGASGLPFVLIDCAAFDAGAAALPRDALEECECLFVGSLAEELADVGPYLARVRDAQAGVREVIGDLLERDAATLVFAKPEVTFAELHRHFRKFNVVYDSEGKALFMRYYDPRVLPRLLAVLEPQQRGRFFALLQFVAVRDAAEEGMVELFGEQPEPP